VLTEPQAFGGSLADLARLSTVLAGHGSDDAPGAPIPTLRKDFLMDPYQVLEARAAGAGGVLVVLRILDDGRLDDILGAAAETGLFVLLEAFDLEDLDRAGGYAKRGREFGIQTLVGLNSRDLVSLAVDPDRLRRLSDRFPPGVPKVAESGLLNRETVGRAAAWGYDLGLVGTALMREESPSTVVASMIEAGRTSRRRSRIGAANVGGTGPAPTRAPGT
jgi:indole-3-glycerol phosphate synthase